MAINKMMRAAMRAISRHNIDVREDYQIQRALFNAAHPPIANPYTMWDHKVTLEGRDIPVRIFAPESGLPKNIIVFYHGGGWVTGNIDSYTTVCSRIANRTSSMVVSVDYRLAPEHPFPAGLEDCYAVTREVFRDASYFELPTERIVLMGDSAGGNLAAGVSLMAQERGEFSPNRQILIYPCTYNDHSPESPYPSVVENGESYILTTKRVRDYLSLYLGDSGAFNDPHFAPLLATDLTGQPTTLIITAEYCPLRDEGEAYGKRLQEAGVDVQIHRISGAIHGYFSLPPIFEPVRRSFELINQFLNGVDPNA